MAQGLAYRFSLVLACLLCFTSAAGAESGRRAAALHWVRLPGAEDCAGGDALSRAVEAKLRREVFPAPRNASVLIEGHVERVAGGYRAALQMRSSNGALLGSRELSSQAGNCDELSETIAVVLAVMIDPDVAAQGKSAAAPEPAEDAARAEARRAQRVVGFTRVTLGLSSRAARMWGGGLAYERGLGRWGGLRVEGVGFSSVVDSITFASTPPAPAGGHPRLMLAYVGLGYCPLWLTTGRLRSAACASSEIGGIRAWNPQLDRWDGLPPLLWLTTSLQARFALRLVGPIEAHVGAAGSLVLMRAPFSVASSTIDIKSFNVSLDVGLGVRF